MSGPPVWGQAWLLQLFGHLLSCPFAVRPAVFAPPVRCASAARPAAAPSLRSLLLRLRCALCCCAFAAWFFVRVCCALLLSSSVRCGRLRGGVSSFAFGVGSFVFAFLPDGSRALARFYLQLSLSVRACAWFSTSRPSCPPCARCVKLLKSYQ